MEVSRIITAQATQFVQKAFKKRKKDYFFNDQEVRHDGQDHFINLRTANGNLKVMEGEWIVEEEGKTLVVPPADFKNIYAKVKRVKETVSEQPELEEEAPETAPLPAE